MSNEPKTRRGILPGTFSSTSVTGKWQRAVNQHWRVLSGFTYLNAALSCAKVRRQYVRGAWV